MFLLYHNEEVTATTAAQLNQQESNHQWFSLSAEQSFEIHGP